MTKIEQSSYSFKLASWSIAGLALSLAVSKAGLSIFSVLLLLAFLSFWVTNREHFRFSQMSNLTKAILGLIVLGAVCSLFSYGGVASLKDYAGKGSLLLVLPISLLFLQYESVRTRALYALVLGTIIASSYSIYSWSQVYAAGAQGALLRVGSFWDMGRWGEFICYFLVLMTPLLFSTQSKASKWLFIAGYIFAIVALLTSGSRAPLLATILMTGVYFVLFNRRLLVPFLVLFVVLIGVIYLSVPTLIEYTILRLKSIFDFTDRSNLGRINIWINALAFFQYNLTHDIRSVLFGSGFENLESTFEAFLHSTDRYNDMMTLSSGEASTTDHHNALLNVINRMGLVYLVGLAISGYYAAKALLSRVRLSPSNVWYQSALLVAMSYLICGIFYSNELNYQTLMAAFMCVLAVRFGDAILKKESQSHV
ncbi:O-antigen ligase family protein [Vibrio sp. SCSIO 43140]|uniref:O-antigen ligase family protein n=1 Tax=Vibrio sp. SCSIO 43140 TaxID=2819100 RepID=UPI002075DB77|nr:O-antigen ligase family protein [Vibrio sp. SCSIO 43140]USD60305.1 O-antigen ligase family protein [Vibrio sp. SCSIO 43140]